jgi:hypothetical protein
MAWGNLDLFSKQLSKCHKFHEPIPFSVAEWDGFRSGVPGELTPIWFSIPYKPLQVHSFTRTLTLIIEGTAMWKIVLSDLFREQAESQIQFKVNLVKFIKAFDVTENQTHHGVQCQVLPLDSCLCLCLEQMQVKFLFREFAWMLVQPWKQPTNDGSLNPRRRTGAISYIRKQISESPRSVRLVLFHGTTIGQSILSKNGCWSRHSGAYL